MPKVKFRYLGSSTDPLPDPKFPDDPVGYVLVGFNGLFGISPGSEIEVSDEDVATHERPDADTGETIPAVSEADTYRAVGTCDVEGQHRHGKLKHPGPHPLWEEIAPTPPKE